jgi:folylpolyglutamate synthase/dihydropteroate synthase
VGGGCLSVALTSVEEAFKYAEELALNNNDRTKISKKVSVLVTGSLHLVGSALAILEDEIG